LVVTGIWQTVRWAGRFSMGARYGNGLAAPTVSPLWLIIRLPGEGRAVTRAVSALLPRIGLATARRAEEAMRHRPVPPIVA
jgi:hypothetical protein